MEEILHSPPLADSNTLHLLKAVEKQDFLSHLDNGAHEEGKMNSTWHSLFREAAASRLRKPEMTIVKQEFALHFSSGSCVLRPKFIWNAER